MNKNNPFIPQDGKTNLPMPGNAQRSASEDFEIDLTGVDSGFTIPDGEYIVECIDVEQGVSRADNPQYIWTFVVKEGEQAGYEIMTFTALTPAAMWKVAETVEALGIGATGQVIRFKKSDVIGKTCRALIEKQVYNNQERSQISRLMPLE